MLGRKRKFDRALRERGVPPTVEHEQLEQSETTGPYDILDIPEDGLERVDLGAIQVPVEAGFDLRLEMNDAAELSGVSVVYGDTLMQLGVFAAPRSGGIWDSVRADIDAEILRTKGKTEEIETEFGIELKAVVRSEGGVQDSRFIGVDGPRWFLRALIAGPAAAKESSLDPFRGLLHNVVVARGTEPKPVREPLTLTLPDGLAEQVEAQTAMPDSAG